MQARIRLCESSRRWTTSSLKRRIIRRRREGGGIGGIGVIGDRGGTGGRGGIGGEDGEVGGGQSAMSNVSYAAVTAGEAVSEKEELTAASVVEANGETKSQQQSGGGESEETTHGFSRPEMHSETLVGSVAYYERHVFLCCKEPGSWPANVEKAGFDPLPSGLAAALKARKNDLPKKTRLTVCEEEEVEGSDSSAGDVIIFPDMVRYKGLTHGEVDSFVEDALVSGKEWKASTAESLSGSHVFVCSHGSRDRRCGACGPVLIEKFREEIKLRGLEGEIFVRACSHIGGHKYAGNLIVFSSTSSGDVSGHWFGYVSPEDVGLILDQHIGKGEIIDRLWRGQMGVNEGDQKLAQQSRLGSVQDEANGCACCQGQDQGAKKVTERSISASCQPIEPAVKENGQIPRSLISLGSTIHDGHVLFFDEEEEKDEEPVDPRITLWGSYYIPLPKWFATWEKEDTNAVLAVVGAAAVVVLAIRVCKEAA